MPVYSPAALSTSVRRFWNEANTVFGNAQRTVITPQFPLNVMWEQNPPQFADILQFNARVLPGRYTFRMTYVDGPLSTDQIQVTFPFSDSITIMLNNPPIAESVEFIQNGIIIENSLLEINIISNFGIVGFTPGNFFSLEREN